MFTASNSMHMNYLLIFFSEFYHIFSFKFTFKYGGAEIKVTITSPSHGYKDICINFQKL
jgi:hypothetical protein